MLKSYTAWSFFLLFLCILLSCYGIYSSFAHTWEITPPVYVLLLISFAGLVLSLIGLQRAESSRKIFLVWLSLILSVLLICGLLIAAFLLSVGKSLGSASHLFNNRVS